MELQGISSHWTLGRGGPQTDTESPPKKMERSNPTERVSGSQRSITRVKAQISLGGISSDNELDEIVFKKTELVLSNFDSRTTKVPKVQEISTKYLMRCNNGENLMKDFLVMGLFCCFS